MVFKLIEEFKQFVDKILRPYLVPFLEWLSKQPLWVQRSLPSALGLISVLAAYAGYICYIVPPMTGEINVGLSSESNSPKNQKVKYIETGCRVSFDYELNNKNGWNIPILADVIRNLCQCVPDYNDYKVIFLQRNQGDISSEKWYFQDERRVTGEEGEGKATIWFGGDDTKSPENAKGNNKYYLVKTALVKQSLEIDKKKPLDLTKFAIVLESNNAEFYRDDKEPSKICDPPGSDSNETQTFLPKTSTLPATATAKKSSALLIVDSLEDANNANETQTFLPKTSTLPATATAQSSSTSLIIDNLEDADNANELGGYWYTYNDIADGGSSQVSPGVDNFSPTPGGANGSNYSAGITGNVTSQFQYGYIGMGTNLNSNNNNSIDLAQYTEIEFWAKGDGKQYRIKLPSLQIEDYNDYGYNFTATPQWSRYVVSFSNLTQENRGPQTVWVNKNLALSQVTDIQWQTVGQPHNSVELAVDDIRFMR